MKPIFPLLQLWDQNITSGIYYPHYPPLTVSSLYSSINISQLKICCELGLEHDRRKYFYQIYYLSRKKRKPSQNNWHVHLILISELKIVAAWVISGLRSFLFVFSWNSKLIQLVGIGHAYLMWQFEMRVLPFSLENSNDIIKVVYRNLQN